MNDMKKIVIIILLSAGCLSAFAQRTINGLVKDESGNPISAVSVFQKGAQNGALTNNAGEFSIRLNDNFEPILEFTAIGYEMQQVTIPATGIINVVLVNQQLGLEEVVVVGYGTQKRASVTGAISSVEAEQLGSSPVSSPTNALTGRVSGLVTRQTSGRPGGDASQLFIRGQATFNNTSPLVLVDGVERDFTQINIDDIESVSILKDASATSVYGVRGANGVVLVTTKRGTQGRVKISLASEYGITHFNRLTKYLNAETTSLFQREGTINVGLDPSVLSNTSNFPVSEYDNYLYRTQLNPFTHPDNDFVETFTKPGSQQKYNLNISGGTDIVKYFVSASYFSQDGMFETDINKLRKTPVLSRLIELSPEVDESLQQPDFDASYFFRRLTARSNLDIQLTSDFKIGINLSFISRRQNRPGFYDGLGNNSEAMRLFGSFYRNAPQIFPLMNPNGSFAGNVGVWRQNPLVSLGYTGFRADYANQLQNTFTMNYNLRKILKGLSVDGKYAYDADWSNWRGMITRPFLYSYNSIDGSYLQGLNGILPSQSSARVSATYGQYMELALRYRTSISRHNISSVVLVNRNSVSSPGGLYSYVPHVYQAAIGRINYDYRNTYLLEANAGYNGSNRFAKGHRYQLFPSVSVGWVFTNEKFMKNLEALNFGKLRASYGEVGNDQLGGFSYFYRSNYISSGTYSFGENPAPTTSGLREGRMANENISWEKASKYNLGLDTRWLDSRLTFSADVFQERRKDILATPALFIFAAGVSGLAPANIGVVDNKGYELELAWTNNVGNDFSYFAKVLWSQAKNTIIEMSESNQPYEYMARTGKSIGQFFGYKFDGFFQSYEEIAASPQQFGLSNLAPGDIKYKDINGDGIINQDDQIPIGKTGVPEITYSLSAGFNYKSFDFSFLIQGAALSSVRMWGDLAWDNSWGNYFPEHINRWTPETAATATYPRFLQKAIGGEQNYFDSDFWLKDGDYLRLKNIQIGYTMTKKLLKGTPINLVRLYANCFNLFTWDKVKRIDPESDPNRNDGYFYPQQRIINVGLNINF